MQPKMGSAADPAANASARFTSRRVGSFRLSSTFKE
jgi:hypothetical protein